MRKEFGSDDGCQPSPSRPKGNQGFEELPFFGVSVAHTHTVLNLTRLLFTFPRTPPVTTRHCRPTWVPLLCTPHPISPPGVQKQEKCLKTENDFF